MVKYTALLYTLVSLWDIHFPRGSLIKPLDSVQPFTETHITDQSLKQVGIDQTCQCSSHTASASIPVGCPQNKTPIPLCQRGLTCYRVLRVLPHDAGVSVSLGVFKYMHTPHTGGQL